MYHPDVFPQTASIDMTEIFRLHSWQPINKECHKQLALHFDTEFSDATYTGTPAHVTRVKEMIAKLTHLETIQSIKS
jgi:hypothetical protein